MTAGYAVPLMNRRPANRKFDFEEPETMSALRQMQDTVRVRQRMSAKGQNRTQRPTITFYSAELQQES